MPQSQMIARQLGRQLRELRHAAGFMSREDPLLEGIASRATIQRIETGQGPFTFKTLNALCTTYGVDAATTQRILAMQRQVSTPGLSEEFGSLVIPDWFGLFADMEESASRIRSYDTEFMPGLLQSEAYARALFVSEEGLPADVIEERVGFRMGRQARVLDGTRDITMILSEAALHRQVGSPKVLAEQVGRVAELASSGTVVVRVLPWQVGAYPRRGEYVLFDFPDKADPPIAYTEIPLAARYIEDAKQLKELEQNFGVLMSKSVPFEEYA